MTTKSGGPGNYKGPERRRAQRRIKKERRDLVRWEPGKTERRHNTGRRSTDMPDMR